ncbi:hypothetical protein ACBI99_11925 [Nonomuraea sp. ATR24]|uniref:hypothetical protein n=1 Tax=Nonomuraea sp. ATR24 TaxID=1676744 RepID=UPI0035BF8ED9
MNAPPAMSRETARITHVTSLRGASDGGTRPLADVVRSNLEHLWQHGGEKGSTRAGRRPEWIYIRPAFMVVLPGDNRDPALPRLVKSKGVQLRLELLLLFDAQCRHTLGEQVRNVRHITPHADEKYASWRQLMLTATDPTRGTGRGPGDLRARQLTEALRALEEHRLLIIPRDPGGRRRRYNDLQLLSEGSTPEEYPRYTVPDRGIPLPRKFFTNLWVFALTDTELATFLLLSFLRSSFPQRHAEDGIFLTAEMRKEIFRITRTTWRSADMLHRFRLIDRMPDSRRNFRTGKVGGYETRWANREVAPAHFKINDEGLEQSALEVIHQVLTAPTIRDQVRREGWEGLLPPLGQKPTS